MSKSLSPKIMKLLSNIIQRFALALGVLLTLGIGTSSAQDSLSLQQARALALQEGHSMQIAHEGEQGARATLEAMRTNYLPKLSLSGIAYYSPAHKGSLDLGTYQLDPSVLQRLAPLAQQLPEIGALLAPLSGGIALPPLSYRLETGNSYYAALSLSQPIYMGGKITASTAMARIGVAVAKAQRSRAQAETLLEVDEAYWQTVQVEALVELSEQYVKTLERVRQDVEHAVRAGMRSRPDLLRVEVELREAELRRTEARNGAHLARLNLARVLGVDSLGSVLSSSWAEQGEVLSEQELTLGDLSSRPEAEMLSHKVELRRQETKIARSEGLPQVGLRASYSYINGVKLNGQKLLDSFTPSVILSVNVPLFSWGETRSKVRKARTEERIALIEQTQLRERMLLEQEQARNQYVEAGEAVRHRLAGVELSEELLQQTQRRYEVGLDTTVDYLQAQTTLLSARTALVKAQTERLIKRTRLLKALGKL